MFSNYTQNVSNLNLDCAIQSTCVIFNINLKDITASQVALSKCPKVDV